MLQLVTWRDVQLTLTRNGHTILLQMAMSKWILPSRTLPCWLYNRVACGGYYQNTDSVISSCCCIFELAKLSFPDCRLERCGKSKNTLFLKIVRSDPGSFAELQSILLRKDYHYDLPGRYANSHDSWRGRYSLTASVFTALTFFFQKKCPGCPPNGLDLSQSLFQGFADISVGVLSGDWSIEDGSPSPSPSTDNAPPAQSPPPNRSSDDTEDCDSD